MLMDSIFTLGEADRTTFLQNIMQAYNCTYICLWLYWPHPSNCLLNLDGLYRERTNQPSSSSGSVAQKLFNDYRREEFNVDNGCVPGLAFKNRIPYMELKLSDLQRLSFTDKQMHFYQEARIKTAVFMGCNAGEIEFGISNDDQINLEMEMHNLFPEDFPQILAPGDIQPQPPADQARPSSSSSSLRSLSVDSSEFSPLLFNIPSNAYIPEPTRESHEQTTTSIPPPLPQPQTIRDLSEIQTLQFPYKESEDAALTNAMLAVISSLSPSPSSSLQSEQKAPAFQRYRSSRIPMVANTRRPNVFRRAITFYRRLSLMQRQEQIQGNRPTTTQLNHMISERRRREKLNESFQSLRSMLPPGTKKDKASVLANTTEYLTSLKSQVAELNKKNQMLELQISPQKQPIEMIINPSTERVEVGITHVAASTSTSTDTESRMVDLQIAVRGGESFNMMDLVICILEFLKQIKNVNLVSIDANTRMVESISVNRVVLRLRIEEGEWDESSFQEAIRRLLDDLAQRQS